MSAHRLSIEPELSLWPADELLHPSLIGLEKESLRVSKDGRIAMSLHPAGLGSALTHPYITTDYSEALIELITPPMSSAQSAWHFLAQLHQYTAQYLQNEFLWHNSMPCILAGENNIPIAQYGSSNLGQMKYIYRVGLGYRYGKTMQVIAGIHFNFSFSAEFWQAYYDLKGRHESLRQFIDRYYMGMARNMQRFGWLIPYLFGASPAVCKSFFSDREPDLLLFDDSTYYEPYATSLRMSDIGYQNRKEKGIGIQANYNHLSDYVISLSRATLTPCPVWQQIGVKVDGQYRQLNANQLQIENEYYSSIRPKPQLEEGKTPSRALWEKGIAYMELRSLDIDPYAPCGIHLDQLNFLYLFMLYCVLRPSHPIDEQERKEIDRNLLWVANQGRDPQLKLQRNGKAILFKSWAEHILKAMYPLAEKMDQNQPDQPYQSSLRQQMEKIDCPELTPSGRILAEMKQNKESFHEWAYRLSQQHMHMDIPLDPQFKQKLDQIAQQSVQKQKELESQSSNFDQYLADYLAGQIRL